MRNRRRLPDLIRVSLSLATSVLLLLSLPTVGWPLVPSATATGPAEQYASHRQAASEAYGKVPLYFEANQGQTDPQVRFLARGGGQTLFLTSTEAVLVLTKADPQALGSQRTPTSPVAARAGTQTVLRMTFAGASSQPHIAGEKELAGKVNYFLGNDPAKWRTNVPTYAAVRYEGLYPGVDLVYYGNNHQLEYDLVVAPGADPSQIALSFEGADRLELDANGDLVLHTATGAIRQHKPVIYQDVGGHQVAIPGGYVLQGAHRVGFQVAAYDESRSLVIDPMILLSYTYLC